MGCHVGSTGIIIMFQMRKQLQDLPASKRLSLRGPNPGLLMLVATGARSLEEDAVC